MRQVQASAKTSCWDEQFYGSTRAEKIALEQRRREQRCAKVCGSWTSTAFPSLSLSLSLSLSPGRFCHHGAPPIWSEWNPIVRTVKGRIGPRGIGSMCKLTYKKCGRDYELKADKQKTPFGLCSGCREKVVQKLIEVRSLSVVAGTRQISR